MKKVLLFSVMMMAAMTMNAVESSIYYVIGSMNDWKVSETYKMTKYEPNTEQEEYFFVVDLVAGAQFKVCSSENGTDVKTWYPDGTGNNYGEKEGTKITEAGKYTVYFRPNKDGNDDWYEKYIYLAKGEPTAIETVEATVKSQKMFDNGQLVIIRDGKTYNALCAEVK